MNRPTLLVGDIHGEWGMLKERIDLLDICECTLINVGDFGIGFKHKVKELRNMTKLNDFFVERDINFLAIRGNHDDPSYFQPPHFKPLHLSNLTLLKDYTALEINGEKWMFIGGGESIDRCRRTGRRDWWKGESVDLQEDKLEKVDVLVTHAGCASVRNACPKSNISSWLERDDTLQQRLDAEAIILDKIYSACDPSFSYNGHYHQHFKMYDCHPGGVVHSLDILEVAQHNA